MHSTLALLFVGLASAPALSLWSQLREQRNRQEPAQQAGVGSQDTPGGAGAGSGEQEHCLRDPFLPLLFYQDLPMCKCWASPAETHRDIAVD